MPKLRFAFRVGHLLSSGRKVGPEYRRSSLKTDDQIKEAPALGRFAVTRQVNIGTRGQRAS